jgi:lipopolysaccharide transport system permease protein
MITNLGWIALVLGIVCARYRDLPQIVNSVLQILIYLTPIMWMPQSISDGLGFYLVQLNPIFHFFDIVRAPLLGYSPENISWIVSITIALFGWIMTLFFYGRYKQRIVFWL